jgi:signal transduction histidine kinase
MTLRNRLSLTYALFIFLGVLVLGIIINRIGGQLFSVFIQNNINSQCEEMAHTISEQYDPLSETFDLVTLETMGMYFVHQGYIISINDTAGNIVWDARSCDMEQCNAVINEISRRMEKDHRLKGGIQTRRYPLVHYGEVTGELSVDTYGPFFYSETESSFLSTVNRFLIAAGIIFSGVSVIISLVLSTAISRPILQAASAAKTIAGGNLAVRIPDTSGTLELQELSRSINDLAAELENGERWQKQLTADIAHELRTPLTCLQGNIEAMIDGVWEATAERLICCREEILRLAKLVEDLNTLSILERETLKLRKSDFDLSKLLSQAVEQFRPQAEGKGLSLVTELSPVPVHADYDRLMQVFVNIISNAVKYTDQGSITVGVSVIESGPAGNVDTAANHTEVFVRDTGIGISEEALPHIFERFYRSDKSRSRSSGGAGIGLTIAGTIVHSHGGKITADSGPGGSVFRVVL